MKSIQRIGLTLGLVGGLILPRAALAHDGWVEISPTLVERNQPVTIALIQGNHSNDHRSYRIAGKWDQKYTTLLVIDPRGEQTSLTDRLIDLGEDADAVGPKGPKGFFLASFAPKEEGLPPDGSSLRGSPREVRIQFTEGVEVDSAELR